MEKGLYLYCIRKRNVAPIRAVRDVDKGRAFTLSHKELEAVVSEVSLREFSSQKIQERAQGDLDWIKEKAQIHEHVIEEAMRVGGKIAPVIPMQFGTIFKTRQGLIKALKKGYLQFRGTLRKLEGKQEWGFKVYLNEGLFAKFLKKDKDLVRKEKEITSLPKGVDFFARKELEGIVKGKETEELESHLGRIMESLRKLSVEVRYGKILDRALTGRKEPMVSNVSFLVKGEKVGKFRKEAEKLRTQYRDLGLEIQVSGPWPPYNFVEITSTAKPGTVRYLAKLGV